MGLEQPCSPAAALQQPCSSLAASQHQAAWRIPERHEGNGAQALQCPRRGGTVPLCHLDVPLRPRWDFLAPLKGREAVCEVSFPHGCCAGFSQRNPELCPDPSCVCDPGGTCGCWGCDTTATRAPAVPSAPLVFPAGRVERFLCLQGKEVSGSQEEEAARFPLRGERGVTRWGAR